MGVEPGSMNRWFHNKCDPSAETVVVIVQTLTQTNPTAAVDLVKLYVGNDLHGGQ
jgi:hypothetical protein